MGFEHKNRRETLAKRALHDYPVIIRRERFCAAPHALRPVAKTDGVLGEFVLRPQGARGQRPPRAVQVPVPGNLHM